MEVTFEELKKLTATLVKDNKLLKGFAYTQFVHDQSPGKDQWFPRYSKIDWSPIEELNGRPINKSGDFIIWAAIEDKVYITIDGRDMVLKGPRSFITLGVADASYDCTSYYSFALQYEKERN